MGQGFDTEKLFEFAKDARSYGDIDSLNERFCEISSSFGYNNYSFVHLIGHELRAKPKPLLGRVNPKFEQRYYEREYFKVDNCLSYLTHSSNPFSWNEVNNSAYSTKAGRQIMNEAKEFKYNDGLLVPLKRRDGRLSVVTLTGEHVDTSEGARISMEIACHFFTEAGTKILEADPNCDINKPLLTPRQIEILKWLSVGKRHQDIADILTISTKTIDRHMEDARKRLNVVTTHQLLVHAVKEGLLN